MSLPANKFWLYGFCALGVTGVFIVAYLFWRAESLASRFSQMYPDETEAKLLNVVGAPTEIRRCDEGTRPVQPRAERPCARVYWYSAYPFDDGWLLPIDAQGTIMQIDRRGLP